MEFFHSYITHFFEGTSSLVMVSSPGKHEGFGESPGRVRRGTRQAAGEAEEGPNGYWGYRGYRRDTHWYCIKSVRFLVVVQQISGWC